MHAYARHQSWTEKATISNHVETLVDTYTNSAWWTCACNGFPTQQPVAHACGGAEKASGMHAGGAVMVLGLLSWSVRERLHHMSTWHHVPQHSACICRRLCLNALY